MSLQRKFTPDTYKVGRICSHLEPPGLAFGSRQQGVACLGEANASSGLCQHRVVVVEFGLYKSGVR